MTNNLSFQELRAKNVERQNEWEEEGEPFSLLYYSNALGGECGEAQNVVKKLERERMGHKGSKATVTDLAEELADIAIYLDLVAAKAGIDLAEAIRTKFNAHSIELGFRTML